MDRCSSCGHTRAEHWPSGSVPLSEAGQRGGSQALDAYLDRLAEVEAEWPADGESVCKVCRCSYYLGTVDVTTWKRLVEGGTDPSPQPSSD
jgi:hypothetical protein